MKRDEELPPQGNPVASECRWCGRTKMLRHAGPTIHRLCTKCDAPDVPGRMATWERP